MFGGPPECPERPDCLPGLRRTYGLRFRAFAALESTGGEAVVYAVPGEPGLVAKIYHKATPEHAEKLAFLQKAAGAILSPFECWLVLRGVKTLAARMEIHDRSGRIVADNLHKHKKVDAVYYPGLPDHPPRNPVRFSETKLGFLRSEVLTTWSSFPQRRSVSQGFSS